MRPQDFRQLAADLRADLSADVEPAALPNIDGFAVTRLIATGGMGTVYEARQNYPDRPVALKLLRLGFASRSATRRFRYETEALARLDHPGIARIYQAGTYDDGSGGVPYFAMELVEDARSISTYCIDEQLPIRDRLELFAAICDAVHHGHQKGIVHRDLKPANILVDAEGRPKIIDFGIARSTDIDLAVTTMHTNEGAVLGTLAYMSPEQCSGESMHVDTTSDVYSLGVVLYELLCEQLPYDLEGKNHTQVARTIEEQPPTEPATVRRELRGDLNAIVLKALEKDQRGRYQSAADLADDVRHYLHGEPIRARMPSRWQRASRWVGRHPVFTTSITCLFIIVLSVAAGWASIWWVNLRPSHVELNEAGSVAELKSYGGRTLLRWGDPRVRSRKISIAELVDVPEERGGGSLVILGLRSGLLDQNSAPLRAVDAETGTIRWSARVTDDELISALQTRPHYEVHGAQFSVPVGGVWDVFDGPEFPGPEVVAVFSHAFSTRIIRIYSVAGECLFELWHDGTIAALHWDADHDMLVCVGDNKEVLEWQDRGIEAGGDPIVVFALRPAPRYYGDGFMPTAGPRVADHPVLLWYRCVLPAQRAARLNDMGIERNESRPDEAVVRVTLRLEVDPVGSTAFGWDVDATGRFIPGTLAIAESYREAQRVDPTVPEPSAFYLGPLPRIVD